jgi:hypothetical protein
LTHICVQRYNKSQKSANFWDELYENVMNG